MILLYKLLIRHRLDLLSIALILFIARMAYPDLTYVFLPTFLLSIILYSDGLRRIRLIHIKKLISNIWEFNIIGLLVIIALIVSSKFYITPIKEFISYIIILVFTALVYTGSHSVILIKSKIIKYLIHSSVLIATIGLLHLFDILSIYENFGSSIVSDNNFYALFSILGIIAILYKTLTDKNNINLLDNISFTLLIFNVLFSLSRRGIIVIIFLFLFIFIEFVRARLSKNKSRLSKLRIGNCINLTIIVVLLLYILMPYKVKSKISEDLGIQHFKIENFTTRLLYEYSTVFSNSITYENIKTSFALSKFDPADPNTWATRKHKVIDDLYGDNIGIVPEGAKGYSLDNETEASTWDNNAYSYTLIGKDSVERSNVINASVFCYVSPVFNGTWVRLSSDGSVTGKKASYYDLDKKGSWQKLSLVAQCQDGIAFTFLYISKYGDTDFSNLEGHVIFAYPEYSVQKLDPKDPLTWGTRKFRLVTNLPGKNSTIVPKNTKGYMLDKSTNANTWSNNAYSFTRIGNDEVHSGDTLIASVYCYASPEFNGTWIRLSSDGADFGKMTSYYDLSKKGEWQKLSLVARCKKGYAPVYLYLSKFGVTDFSNLSGYAIFAYPKYEIIQSKKSLTEPPPKDIAPAGDESTNNAEHPIKNIGNLDNWESNKLTGQRIARWIYAWEIFINDYTLFEKIFGGGFDYISLYNSKFSQESKKDDYPHNPIISCFLYSGILGGIFYFFFLATSLTIYWKNRKKLSMFLLMYVICIFFTFFSGNSHFSVPVFALLSIIPFLTRFQENNQKRITIV